MYVDHLKYQEKLLEKLNNLDKLEKNASKRFN